MHHHPLSMTTNRLALAVLAAATLLAALGTSIATVALPTLAQVFSASVQQVQWVVLSYLLAVTVAIVVAGRLGDLYGHRRVLIAGLALFTAASLACALAGDLRTLVAARTVQGLGAAVLMSLPLSIAKASVARERMGSAMGLMGSMSALGTALGPSLGGTLIGVGGWACAFLVLALCAAAVLLLAHKALPAAHAQRAPARGHMDWPGCFWLALALTGCALAAAGGQAGMAAPQGLWLLVAALSAWAFVRTELRAPSPLVHVDLVRESAVGTALLMNLLIGAAMMATLVVGPFLLSFGLGLDAAQTGLVMAIGPAMAALSGLPAGRITDRFGVQRTLLAGLALATASLCGFALLPGVLGVPGYALALALLTPGFQLFLAANNTAVMQGAADQHRGMLSGLLGLSRNLGFMAGASLLPLLFTRMLGVPGLAGSPPQAIVQAFALTFLATAGLCAVALVLALRAQRRGRHASRGQADQPAP